MVRTHSCSPEVNPCLMETNYTLTFTSTNIPSYSSSSNNTAITR